MISKKLAIMKALTAELEQITPAWTDLPAEMQGETCPYDLTGKVFRGREEFGKEVKVPFIAILEDPRQFNPVLTDGDLLGDEDWGILIQGFAEDDRTHPTDPAYQFLAWVQMRLSRITAAKRNGGRGGIYPDSWRLGALSVDIRYQIPVVRPGKDAVSATAYFYMPISVGTVTDLSMPFIQED
jgi:hypothetical protein